MVFPISSDAAHLKHVHVLLCHLLALLAELTELRDIVEMHLPD